jgi:hypothetical protein
MRIDPMPRITLVFHDGTETEIDASSDESLTEVAALNSTENASSMRTDVAVNTQLHAAP